MHRSLTFAVLSCVAGAVAPLAAAAQPQGLREGLPGGDGSDLIAEVCTGCHRISIITRSSGYSRDGWEALIASMVDLSGDVDSKAQILDYLAAHFPPNETRAATLVDGPLEIAFEEWVTPTLGQRTRDPVEAPDGTIWWVGQGISILGRIDPQTGGMKEYPLPADARPHSVNVGPDGDIWYLGNGNGTLGRLDRETEEFTIYEMPDPEARDPHTGEFDQDGLFWFTLQRSNMIGRMDPATGKIDLATLPRPGSRPYGIKIDADGTPWVACNGKNCLIKVDPATMALEDILLPGDTSHVRRFDLASDGSLWYGNAGMGKIGHYDPKTGAIREWDSPSGPRSHPYAMAVVDDIVWYNESGMRPDPLVRFDPETEEFQSWPVPSGEVYAGIIRHMRPTAEGDLLIHQSSTNRVLRVTLPDTE